MPTRAVRWLIVLVSLAIYIASLALPALQVRHHHNEMPEGPAISASPSYPPVLTPPPPPLPDPIISHKGWKMLLVSVAGPMDGNFAILANPMLLIGWVLLLQRRYRWAAVTLGLALLFAMQTFQLIQGGMYEDESGTNISYLTHPLLGWYLWIAAMLLPLGAAIYFQRRSAAQPASNTHT